MDTNRTRQPVLQWSSPREALRLCLTPRVLRRTLVTALVVGTILSLVNQLHVITSGAADTGTGLRIAANYAIPFIVSNVGALSATRTGTA